MSVVPFKSDNGLQSSLGDVGLCLQENYEPTPTYDENNTPTSGNSRGQDSKGALEYKQISTKLIELVHSIRKMPPGMLPLLLQDLRAILLREPPANKMAMVDFVGIIYNTCKDVYQRDEGSSTSHTINNLQLIESPEGTTNDEQPGRYTTSRFHVQKDQDAVMENQPPTTTSPTTTRTISLVQRNQSSIASINTIMPKKDRIVQEDIVVSGTLAREEGLEPSSPSIPLSSNNALTEDTTKDSEGKNQALYRPLKEFTQEARQKVEKFFSVKVPDKTEVEVINLLQDVENEGEWESGLKLLSEIESARGIMDWGSIKYAIAAMRFAKWHESQVSLTVERIQSTESLKKTSKGTSPEAALKEASKSVTSELIRHTLAEGSQEARRIQLRKNIGTYLTRGRKWYRLVLALGFGILFFDLWTLVKTPNQELDLLITELQEDQGKMIIFKGLEEQVVNLFKEKRTNKQQFDKYLRSNNCFAVDNEESTDPELDEFYEEVKRLSTGDRLVIGGTGHTFDKESLLTLRPDTWLNGDIVVAFLHLSVKLDFVRVWKSIPIHQTPNTHIPLRRPFECAAAQVSKWRAELGPSTLVCLFVLLLNDNHFTLLEINDREGYIYHYNSLKGSYKDVKEACEKEIVFSHLKFEEKEAMQQRDSHSCGLMVIKHAQSRMLNLPATHFNGSFTSSKKLRCEVISRLRMAWTDGIMLEAPRRKRKIQTDIEQWGNREQIERQMNVQYEEGGKPRQSQRLVNKRQKL